MTNIYFSDFFGASPSDLEAAGAVDISLVGDLPLFIDPFLLFNSDRAVYQRLHGEILRYMRFLRDVTLAGGASPSLVRSLFAFPEVKQTWLGFSRTGNRGRGLGADFAASLHRNFGSIFRNFGEETVTRSSHLEKLCLIEGGVGRDTISDFTTNLIKYYLADFTQEFATAHLKPSMRRRIAVSKSLFNYETRSWSPRTFDLPYINGDFVLLTPKDILTKDEAWINRPELIDDFLDITSALPDEALRAQINDYFYRTLPRDASKEETAGTVSKTIEQFPHVLDYYILRKEENGADATSVARERVRAVESQFIALVRQFVHEHLDPGGFYRIGKDTYDEAKRRLLFLKDIIENKGGHKIFYLDGKPIHRESDLHVLYRLTWFATPSDISREVNDGRGPADFKASRGSADKTLVEFKLASNSKLERNLKKQSAIYEKASGATSPSLKAILFFSEHERRRVSTILRGLELESSPHVILIDARDDNKQSGSRA